MLSPSPGTFFHAPEVDVRGRIHTYDGRAWVWVEGVMAEVEGERFLARDVPLKEGKNDLRIELTDGQGRKTRTNVPVTAEDPDRPRAGRLCDPAGVCIAYEERGRPRREGGLVRNAVVVVSAFGFDERLDELWPELVGPGHPLDSRRALVLGVAPARRQDGRLASSAETVRLLERLVEERRLDRPLRAVGASSLGAEIVLRWLSRHPDSLTDLVICGGHDAPGKEPVLRALGRQIKGRELPARGSEAARALWQELAALLVPSSFSEAYLADPAHAIEHGIALEEAQRRGLRPLLIEKMAAYWADSLDPEDLRIRLGEAAALGSAPLLYSPRPGTHLSFVANRRDRTITLGRIEQTVARLRRSGAEVELRVFEDALGHSAFFRATPRALAEALARLIVP